MGQASTRFGTMKYMKQDLQPAATRTWLPEVALTEVPASAEVEVDALLALPEESSALTP